MQRARRWRAFAAATAWPSKSIFRCNLNHRLVAGAESPPSAALTTFRRWNTHATRTKAASVTDPVHKGVDSWREEAVIYEQLEQPSQTLDDREIINTSSLEDTLRAHRKANEDAVPLRRIFSDWDNDKSNSKRKSIPTKAQHLVLDRSIEPNKRGLTKGYDDYQGQVKPLSFDWIIIGNVGRYVRLPWMQSVDATDESRESSSHRLNTEIRAADAFFTPTHKEAKVAQHAFEDIRRLILEENDQVKRVDLIGSRAGGFATPMSDLDINLVPHDQDSPHNTLPLLDRLYKQLRFSKQLKAIEPSYFARGARVPILVGVHPPTGIEVQIQSATTGYGSLEVCKLYAAELPALKALFRIIKQMLKMRGLSEGNTGGLTSYPLLNMLAVSLKLNAANSDPYDLGSQLLHFLNFYANFNFYQNAITYAPSSLVTNPHMELELGSTYKDEGAVLEAIGNITQDPAGAHPLLVNARCPVPLIHDDPQDNFMMTLHDPGNPYNDLGRSAYQIKHIQSTFIDVHSRLKHAMLDWDRSLNTPGLHDSLPPSLLAPLIEGDYTLYQLERKRLSNAANSSRR